MFYLISTSYNIDNHTWEPHCIPSPTPEVDEPVANNPQQRALGERQAIEDALCQHVYVYSYPTAEARTPTNRYGISTNAQYKTQIHNAQNNPFAPFKDCFNWEIARWAKLRGPGSNALNDLLKIQGVSLMFKSVRTKSDR